MSRIPGGSNPMLPPSSPGVRSDATREQPTTNSVPRTGLSRADMYSRAGNDTVLPTNFGATVGSGGRATTVMGAQQVGATSKPSVQLDPMAMLGNLHTGDINIELPIDKSLLKHPLVNVRDGANAKVRLAIKDGQIDFKKSRVSIDGVSAVGILSVRGAYLDDKGELHLDMTGPDINITKAAIGDKRIPRSMEKFAQAVDRHYGGAKNAEKSSEASESGSSQRFSRLRFTGKGVSLRPDRALSLGEGNNINFQPNTKIDVEGNLSRVSVSGRVGINNVALKAGDTAVNLGKGDVDLKATAFYGGDGLRAGLSLDKLNLDVNRISHSMNDTGGGVDLRNGQVRDGSIAVQVQVDSQGKTTIPFLQTKGEFSAETIRYDDGGRLLEGGNVQFGLDARSSLTEAGVELGDVKIDNLSGDVYKLSLTDSSGKTVKLEDARVDGFELTRTKKTDGTFTHDGGVKRFEGTIEGDIDYEGMGVTGSTSFERTTAAGNVSFERGKLTANFEVTEGSGRTKTVLDRSKVSLGDMGELTIAAGTQADFALASSTIGASMKETQMEANGKLKGRLESGYLKLGGAGQISLDDASIDLDLKSIDKREGETLPRFKGDLKLSVDSDIQLEQGMLRRAGITSVKGAEGKISLDLKDASLNGDGKLRVQRAGVELEASVREISGRIQVPGLASAGKAKTYTVKSGDVLSRIAREHQSTVGEFSELNNLSNPNQIRVGQVLKIPGTVAASAPVATTGVAHSPAAEVVAPSVAVKPIVNKPLSFNPIELAGRIQNGTVEMEVPLNEEGIENSTKVLGVKALDLQPDTRLQAKLVVENGTINFAKSSFKFNKDPSAAGLVDVHPRLTSDGQIRVGVLGGSINITDWVTDSERLPSRMSELTKSLAPKSSKTTTTSGSVGLDASLAKGRQFVDIGDISLKAEGVTLASGRLNIGDNDYIELGENNRIDLNGTSRALTVSGSVDAKDAYVDVGGAVMDLGQGKVSFDASIQTGLSTQGTLDKASTVDVSFRVPEAKVDLLQVAPSGGKKVELRDGSVKDLELVMSHRFERDASGEIKRVEDASKTTLTVGSFEGEISNTSLPMKNADGSMGAVDIVSAKSRGNLKVGEDGQLQAQVQIDELDAYVANFNLEAKGSSLKGLDGSLIGAGTLSFDSKSGLLLDGNFRADAKIEDGRLALDSFTDLDLGRNSRANIQLTQLDTTQGKPVVQGDMQIDASLDAGQITLPDGQELRFDPGSKLQLSSQLGRDQSGALATMSGKVYANLGQQKFKHSSKGAVVSGELHDGVAQIDLGEVTIHEDGRYRILNPEVKMKMDLNLFGRQN